MTPPKPSAQATYNNARRRTLSDYRSDINSSVTVDSNPNGKTVSSIKNATKTLASGLNKFKRMVKQIFPIIFSMIKINMFFILFCISVGHWFEKAFKYGE